MRIVQLGTARARDEGLRIATVRRPPRRHRSVLRQLLAGAGSGAAMTGAVVRAALLLVVLLSTGGRALAQADAAIPEPVLRAPWEQHLRILESIPAAAFPRGTNRTTLADELARLQVALGEFEIQVDEVIDRVIGDPQYAYVAAEESAALGAQLADVHARFAAVYAALGLHAREDVRNAQASLHALQTTLEGSNAFERDVLRALGSGSRQQIVELATRWWNGEERAIAVKKRVAAMRDAVEGLAASGRAN